MAYAETITTWFEKELTGGLILPDGWFGRPYDGQYSLTSVEEQGESLVLVLSENLILRFSGLRSVAARGDRLAFGPFTELHFEWTPFDGGSARNQDYHTGEAFIVSGPG